MKLTNHYGLPDWLIEAVGYIQSKYEPGEKTDYSATSLAEPPMIAGLKYQYRDQLEQDASEALAAFMGTCVHDSLEEAIKDNERYIVERRFYNTIHVPDSPTKKDFVISGQIDLYDLETQHLSDHKITSTIKILRGDHSEYEAQASVNRWLMRANGYDPKSFSIAGFLKDWRRGESKRDSNYPNFPFKKLDLPFWSEEATEEYIRNAIIEKEFAKQGIMRPCTKEERWQRDGVFAIMKKGRKSSIRNLSTREEAEQYIKDKDLKGVWIEERKGEAIRCDAGYCPVAQFCNQSGPL